MKTENKFSAKKTEHKSECPCAGNSIARSKGEVTIVVRRQSFRIKKNLPYCIWGTQYLQGNSFAVALIPYIPVGVTLLVIQSGNTVTFQYTQGANVDNIIVTCPPNTTISYMEIIQNLNTNFLKSELIYFNCNADANSPTLTTTDSITIRSQILYFLKKASLGKKTTETLIPQTRTQVNNSQPNIVELSFPNKTIKPDTVWVHTFPFLLLGGGPLTELTFYWQVIINDIINVNEHNQQVIEANG
jgi:hypothetical protein